MQTKKKKKQYHFESRRELSNEIHYRKIVKIPVNTITRIITPMVTATRYFSKKKKNNINQ